MVRLPDPSRLLEHLTAYRVRFYRDAIRAVVIAEAIGDKPARLAAERGVERVVHDTMAMGEVYGATSTLREVTAAELDEGARFGWDRHRALQFAGEQAVIPSVSLEEAIQDMVTRVPVFVQAAAGRVAQRIAEMYSSGERVVAFARAINQTAVERGQQVIQDGLDRGLTEIDAGRALRETNDWSEGYARMAFRTNINTATVAGRLRQARDPDVQAVTPAFQFSAVGDSDTRDNHAELDGLVLATGNPNWDRLAPPLGYNCRCRIGLISFRMLQRTGRWSKAGGLVESRIPRGAGPDEGFRPLSGRL